MSKRNSGFGTVTIEEGGAPVIAVVVPAYNAERTLAATLESIRRQTLTAFEAVVVDDGSTDTTSTIASTFAARDSRFRVVRQPNGGLAEARNAGIRATSAPLIAPVDADDVWHPTLLQKLAAALVRQDAVLAYANSRIIDMKGRVLRNAPSYAQHGWVFNQLLLLNFVGNGSAMMFRRDVAVQSGGYEPRLQHEFGVQGAEDWLLALRLAARGNVAAVSEYLVGYRAVPGAMSANTLRMRRSRLRALEILYAELAPPSTPPVRWALGTAHAKCFLHELRAGEVASATRNLLRATRFDPFGTCRLLLGGERWQWLRGMGDAPLDLDEAHAFEDMDPQEGRVEFSSRRNESARACDAERGGPIAPLRVADRIEPTANAVAP